MPTPQHYRKSSKVKILQSWENESERNEFNLDIFQKHNASKQLTQNSTGNVSESTPKTQQTRQTSKNLTQNHTNASFKKTGFAKVSGSHETGNPLVLILLSLAVLVFKRRN